MAYTVSLANAHGGGDVSTDETRTVSAKIEERFEVLSRQSTNACGLQPATISRLNVDRLQGSCCGPMVLGRYREQIAGLQEQFGNHEVIPADPYDVSAEWAERWIAYNDNTELTPQQQAIFDAAKGMSHEGGPCCCQCWRYYAYSGVTKYMIVEEGVTAQQVADLWDLSDGCGGHGH